MQVSSREVGFGQICIAKIRPAQISSAQISRGEISSTQIGLAEFCPGEVNFTQVGPAQVHSVQLDRCVGMLFSSPVPLSGYPLL